MTYEQLLKGLPRPITNDQQFLEAQHQVNQLTDKLILTEDEKDYLLVLGLLISHYEQRFLDDFELKGFALLRAIVGRY